MMRGWWGGLTVLDEAGQLKNEVSTLSLTLSLQGRGDISVNRQSGKPVPNLDPGRKRQEEYR
jgi:hypothetical protein